MADKDPGSPGAGRLSRIRDIFDGALDLEGDAREAYLDIVCGGDAELRGEVEEFLRAYARGRDTLDNPVAGLLIDAFKAIQFNLPSGTRIGRYEIVREIGRGGMGAVYEAVRADDQFRKQVAIKLLRNGIEGDHAIRRFRRERQILANLNHKNITSLLDGGVTPGGQPYIVMEYVDGVPITTYCDRLRLGLDERLQLLRQVCGAVQHAHQKLIVHRDLKPGNILVTGDGTVKLLDFGIARLLQADAATGEFPVTQGPTRAYTPEYASPEQVRGEAVLTASDIYSLGVVACEVLTRHRPFDFTSQNVSQIQSTILFSDPPLPSSLPVEADVVQLGERSLSRIVRSLRGDIDAIILQALRKEPERRYGTVEQMSRDMQRYVDGLPVSARLDSVGYRIGKFLKRHKFESALAAALLASVLAGTAASLASARTAERLRAVAELERGKTEQVNSFLVDMLSAADASEVGQGLKVVDVLRQAAADIDGRELDPEIEAQIRQTIAQAYYGLGLYDEADVHAERAWELRRAIYGSLDQRSTYSLSYVAGLAEARGDYAVAESLAQLNVDLQRHMPRPDTTALATALDNLARMVELQGRLEEAMPIKLESMTLRRSQNDSAARAAISYTLANLAVSYQYLGNFVKAESLAREALGYEASVHTTESFQYGTLLRNLASILESRERYREADSVLQRSLSVLGSKVGTDHVEYLKSVALAAEIRYQLGDMHGAIAAGREVERHIGVGLHESDVMVAASLRVLGLALDSLHRYDEGGEAFLKSLEIRRKYLPPDHWAIASSEAHWGHHLSLVGREAEAEEILTRAYRQLAKERGEDVWIARQTAARLAEMMTRQGRMSEAAAWRARSN